MNGTESPAVATNTVERRFRSFVESAPDAVVIADGNGRIVLVNAQTERLFGYQRAELLGELVETLVPVQFRGVHPQRRAAYFASPHPRLMGSGLELSGVRKDGTQFPIEISLSPLETDSEQLVASSIRDLTERRAADELRFQLAAMVDSAVDAMIGCTLDGRITSWNRSAEGIFGYTDREALGHSVSMLLPLGHQDGVEDMLAQISRGERGEPHDAIRRRNDGGLVNVSISISPIRDRQGIPIGASQVVRDITQRRLAELALSAAKDAAETSSRAFEAFSYSVAHDLRAPLRAIDGFSRALSEEYGAVLGEAGQDYLSRVRGGAQQMAQLIEGLLSLAGVTHRELAYARVDLSALAEATVAALRRESPSREVDVIIQPGLTAHGDRILLANALQNLITNAWKFTQDRPGARIEFGRDESGYFVRDNGAGFDMAFSAKLFGVFQRLHSQVEFAGTGIGLATVERIITRHGGRIWAAGAVGEGATFHFTLAEPV